MLPGDLLEYLGVEREWRQEFELGDLTRKQFDMGIATLGIEDVERQCPVMFDPEGEGLLGATTLEIFSLGVDRCTNDGANHAKGQGHIAGLGTGSCPSRPPA